jgi:hypothetical protein
LSVFHFLRLANPTWCPVSRLKLFSYQGEFPSVIQFALKSRFIHWFQGDNVVFARRVQLIDATLYLYTKRWSVSNGLPDTDQVHSATEG